MPRRVVIVSNRVPMPKERAAATGGLTVAVRDAMPRRRKLWFGWSGRTAARETQSLPSIARAGWAELATIDLTEADYRGFYLGFANSTLWPLLHYRTGVAEYRRSDLERYLAVNAAFARALVPLLDEDDLVWVHDYHLIPMGAALRALGVRRPLGFFLHVPFPPPEVFSVLPRYEELLRALDAYDVIGVQTPRDAAHMNQAMSSVAVAPRADAFPVGIDAAGFAALARRAAMGRDSERLHQSLGGRALVLGVDRLDYSKGLPQRFPRICRPSSGDFPEHRLPGNDAADRAGFARRGRCVPALRTRARHLAGRINGEHAESDWIPLRYLTRGMARQTVAGFYRYARVGPGDAAARRDKSCRQGVCRGAGPGGSRGFWCSRGSPARPRTCRARSSSILSTRTRPPRRCTSR